ncbi:hypothetical protein SAMN04488061_2735 [Filomicrobium insigne]|uniref:Uncharacterized protein n=1 Tax=Filomicrobium insigne TaxID=418854 RepID=A0A1H0RJ31_9HYPH|nr:hypothetical protein [Filomicrobium insigne]SDP29016.1 hypothetical protein SAMN04488061_2735 [Filomicrobium insigne]
MSSETIISGFLSGLLVLWADRTFRGTLVDRATALTIILLHAALSCTAIVISCVHRPGLVDFLMPIGNGFWSLNLLIIGSFLFAGSLVPFALALMVRSGRTQLVRLQATVIVVLMSWGILSSRESIHGTTELLATYAATALFYLPALLIASVIIQSLRAVRRFSEALLIFQDTVDRETDGSISRSSARWD